MRISDWSSDVCSSDLCTEIGGSAIVVQEADQAKVFDATTLAGGCRKDHDLREIVAAIALDPNARVRPVLAGDVFSLQHERHGARRIDCYGSVRGAKPGAKGDGGDRKSTRLNSSH